MEIDQGVLCDYCLRNILDMKYACTLHFQCEGRFCDQAKEEYLDSLKEED